MELVSKIVLQILFLNFGIAVLVASTSTSSSLKIKSQTVQLHR